MQKFTRTKTLKELAATCADQGWVLNTERFDAGSDYVSVTFNTHGKSGRFLLSMVNGRFFGDLYGGGRFSSDSDMLDDEPWFKYLLNSVYIL